MTELPSLNSFFQFLNGLLTFWIKRKRNICHSHSLSPSLLSHLPLTLSLSMSSSTMKISLSLYSSWKQEYRELCFLLAFWNQEYWRVELQNRRLGINKWGSTWVFCCRTAVTRFKIKKRAINLLLPSNTMVLRLRSNSEFSNRLKSHTRNHQERSSKSAFYVWNHQERSSNSAIRRTILYNLHFTNSSARHLDIQGNIFSFGVL